jgi:hypothetical protein
MVDPPSKDGGGPPKAQEGWGLLLETGEQISSGDKKITLLTSRCQRKYDISPIINAEASEGVDNMDSDEEDTFSLAPRSQEGNFFVSR